MKDKWLNDIHNRMESFETPEPENLWDNIQEHLDKKTVAVPRHIIMTRIKYTLAIAAMLTLIATTIFWLSNPSDKISLQPIHDNTVENNRNSNIINPIADLTESPAIFPQSEQATYAAVAPDKEPIIDHGKSSETTLSPEVRADSVPKDATPTELPTSVAADNRNNERKHIDYATTSAPFIRHKNGNSGTMSLSLYTSGALNSTTNQKGVNGNSPVATNLDKAHWNDSPMLGMLLFNKGREIRINTKHHLPIRAGIIVGYRLLPRLSFETGLTYTCLISDMTYGSDTHYLSGRQTLHYVGIPLGIRYRVFSWQKLEVYGACGALAEKCVSGNTQREFIIENRNVERVSERTLIKQLQWSVNTSTGIQFNLSARASIYAEPGISYYFNNGSEIETIYKDRPLNFNLNLGLRLTFGHD